MSIEATFAGPIMNWCTIPMPQEGINLLITARMDAGYPIYELSKLDSGTNVFLESTSLENITVFGWLINLLESYAPYQKHAPTVITSLKLWRADFFGLADADVTYGRYAA